MSADRLRPSDGRILRYLDEHAPEYVPPIATRLGLPLGHATGRVESLVERGYLAAVTKECIYGITEAGERTLAETRQDAGTAVGVTED